MVEQRLLWADATDYRLHAWVVMPNRVHVLFTPTGEQTLSNIVEAWKSVSTRRINSLLGRRGGLWQPDYFDRYIRHERHFNAEAAYIEANPVTAGLCADAADWRWSSAWPRREDAGARAPSPALVT